MEEGDDPNFVSDTNNLITIKQKAPAGIAFYVEFPAEPLRGLPRTERFHGSIFVGEEVTGKFVPAKAQYIGQLELLAALTPYTSLGGKLKGSLRRAGLGEDPSFVSTWIVDCPIWFQWVPSKANIADLKPTCLLAESTACCASWAAWRSLWCFPLSPFERWDTPFARWTPVVAEGESSDARRQRGSTAVGNLVARAREASDPSTWEVKVDRSSPLGNPFPMSPVEPGARP
eukprot:scaffold3760_cov133-Isochrysis_galbana.AAC.1